MLELTNADARNLRRLLLVVEQHLRERAAEQSYRATACKAVGEKLLSEYHVRRAEDALGTADMCFGVAAALTPAEEVRWQLHTRIPAVQLRVPVELQTTDLAEGLLSLDLDRADPQRQNLAERERLAAGGAATPPAPLPGGIA